MLVEPSARLTHQGALLLLEAAVAEAEALGQPQCIVIVDASGVDLAVLRMAGAKVLSLESARSKARTAASIGAPSAEIPEPVRPAIAAATGGAVTGLAGGFPIRAGGVLIGGIGIGSGSPGQDCAVAEAALAAFSESLGP
ncbi:MAG: heme-binding protein [Silicimonas sp.]|nr:heme-binding protein [Silicimonas sp.]